MGLLEDAKRLAAAQDAQEAKVDEEREAIERQIAASKLVGAAWIAEMGTDPTSIAMLVGETTRSYTTRHKQPDDWGGPHYYDYYQAARTVLKFEIEKCEFVVTVLDGGPPAYVQMCVGIDTHGTKQYRVIDSPAALVQAILDKEAFFRT